MYSLFTIEPLDNSHLGISKMLRKCVALTLSLDIMLTNESKRKAEQKPLERKKNVVLRG